MSLDTAKALTVFYDNAMKVMNENNLMAQMADVYSVDSATMQNSSNTFWRPVEMHAPVKTGWDLTGQQGDVIEQYYPSTLEDPKNDFFRLRADDFRDSRFLERRAMAAAKRLSADQNKRIANLVRDTGSLFYRSSTPGFDFIADADALMTERQAAGDMGLSFFLNARDNNRVAADLAGRGTLAGRPEGAYASAMVGQDIAGFDVYKTAFQSTLTGGASPAAVTVASDVSLKPEGNVSTAPNATQNVDYRVGVITLSDATNYNIGDAIKFDGIDSVGLLDKTLTGQEMTFRIVAKNGNDISVYPKPIALQDPALTAEEAAFANIDQQIVTGTAVTRLNTDAAKQVNSFWANDSIEIVSGDVPFEVFSELDGFKVVSETLDSGVRLYMAYQGSIATMNLDVRLFTWYGLTNRDPSRNGIALLD